MTARRLFLSLEEVASQIRTLEQDIREGGANVENLHLLNHYRHVYSGMRDKLECYSAKQIRKMNDKGVI